MGRSASIVVSLGSIVLLVGIIGGVIGLGTGVAVADNHSSSTEFAFGQDGQCIEAAPLGDATQTVEEFYDYRNHGSGFSSWGTDHLQQTRVSQLFVYSGSEGQSLVFIHDKRNDDDGGGAITMTVTGLPEDGSWPVEDDTYDGRDDNFHHSGTTSEIDWMWAPDRTDGGAFRGLHLEGWEEIEIEPAFSEESWAHQERDPRWAYSEEEIEGWIVRDGTGDTMRLDQGKPVSIRKGSCDGTSPDAAISGPDSTTTESTITVDASGSTSQTAIVEYRWDLNGDGTIDDRTTTDTIQHRYAEPGEVAPVVTVVDRFGNHDAASVTIDVRDDTPPDAALTAPESAPRGETVELDASGSSDNGEIVEYRWDVIGDGSIDESTTSGEITHTYAEAGNYTPTVTVIDAAGNTDTATVTIEIVGSNPPDATADVPAVGEVGTPVDLSARNSTDDGEITSYEWDLGDGNTATGVEITHRYDDRGEYTVTLTVTDDAGLQDTDTASIQIGDATPPTAELSAPGEAEVQMPVVFDARNSTDNEGIVEYRWDLSGDGTTDEITATGTIEHTFDRLGAQEVAVTVVDGGDNTDVDTAVIDVFDAVPPEAAISAPSSAGVDSSVTVDGEGSDDNHEIVDYAWDFGDGETGTGVTADHTYGGAGTYTITLTVTDRAGNTNTTSTTISVTDRSSEEEENEGESSNDNDDSEHDSTTGTPGAGSGGSGQSGSGASSGDGDGNDGEDADDNGDPESAPRGAFTVDEAGVAAISITDAVAGEPVNLTPAETVSVGQSGLELRSMQVIPERNRSYLNATIHLTGESRSGDPLPSTGEPLAVLAADHDPDETQLRAVTYELAIPTATLADNHGTVDNLIAHSWSGDRWQERDVTVVSDGADESIVRVTTEGIRPAQVGVLRPAITVTGVAIEDDPVVEGVPVTVTATLENGDEVDGIRTVDVSVDGQVVGTLRENVTAGGARESTTTVRFDTIGDHTVRVGDQTVTVTVVGPTGTASLEELSVRNRTVAIGETTRLDATVVNRGIANETVTVNFSVFGEVVERQRIALRPGERHTLTFTQRFDAPGTYTLSVAGQDTTVEVHESRPTDTPTDRSDGTDLPMHPIVVLSLILLSAGIVAWRRF